MTPSEAFNGRFRELREQAERILRGQDGSARQPDRYDDFLRLVHELEVHQVELEIQNEELRRAQAELEASRDRFADLYDNAPVAYVILDPQGMIQRENRRARELLGGGGSLAGRPLSGLVHEDDLFVYHGYISSVTSLRGTGEAVELRMTPRSGGAPVHVRLQSSLVREPGGGIHWRLCLSDVTAQKEAEQRLENLAASLEEQVRDRTAELERSEARARDEAGRRRRLAGRLVALLEEDRRATAMDLHDDIGQILAGAKLQLESARAEQDGDRAETARQLGLAAEQLQDAVGRLRSTSRSLHPTSLSVLGLEAALRSLTEESRGSGCRLRFFFHQVPGDLDPDRALAVFRIAQEAVTNAVRHSGCREIHVSLSVRDDALHLAVEDDGCGLEWDEAVSEASGKGPLGLVIMRERAVHAGGSLHVDSTPGRGTVVTSEIPLEAPTPPRGTRRDGT